jgi:hypothetical protein
MPVIEGGLVEVQEGLERGPAQRHHHGMAFRKEGIPVDPAV